MGITALTNAHTCYKKRHTAWIRKSWLCHQCSTQNNPPYAFNTAQQCLILHFKSTSLSLNVHVLYYIQRGVHHCCLPVYTTFNFWVFQWYSIHNEQLWVLCCNTSNHAIILNALFYCIRHPLCLSAQTAPEQQIILKSRIRVLPRHASMNKTKSNATLLLLRIHNLLISITYKIVKWDTSIYLSVHSEDLCHLRYKNFKSIFYI